MEDQIVFIKQEPEEPCTSAEAIGFLGNLKMEIKEEQPSISAGFEFQELLAPVDEKLKQILINGIAALIREKPDKPIGFLADFINIKKEK